MNTGTLEIIDRAFKYSLWAFLICFLVILLSTAVRLRTKRKVLSDYFREHSDKRYEEKAPVRTTPRVQQKYVPSFNLFRMATRAFVLSLILAGTYFVVYLFTPFPFFENFVTRSVWKVEPLRITALSSKRSYEGFSLQGEIWNQTQEPIEDMAVMIRVLGIDQKLLEEVSVPVNPRNIPPGSPATFHFRYSKNSPFLYGYQLVFVNPQGGEIPHTTGFDVH